MDCYGFIVSFEMGKQEDNEGSLSFDAIYDIEIDAQGKFNNTYSLIICKLIGFALTFVYISTATRIYFVNDCEGKLCIGVYSFHLNEFHQVLNGAGWSARSIKADGEGREYGLMLYKKYIYVSVKS